MNYNAMEYIFRGLTRNENAICRTNKSIRTLAKCNARLGGAILCVCAGVALIATVVNANARDIAELQLKVDKLTKDVEELKEQKGA